MQVFERMSPESIVKEWGRETERGGKPIKDEQIATWLTGLSSIGDRLRDGAEHASELSHRGTRKSEYLFTKSDLSLDPAATEQPQSQTDQGIKSIFKSPTLYRVLHLHYHS